MTTPATQQTEMPHGTMPPLAEVRMTTTRDGHPLEIERKGLAQMPGENEFAALMQMAEMLAKSGFMPSKLNTAGKVLAVILTGRELGLPPMLSTRSIKIMEDTGLPIVAADVLLGAFKRAGGKSNFKHLDDKRGELWLKHPNGDEYTEIFTIEDAKRAGLTEKRGGAGGNNWVKYPKAMIRSRCITAGLKSLGWEPAAGVYDADEAEEIAASAGKAPTITATVSENGAVEATDTQPEPPKEKTFAIRGVPLDARNEDGSYKLSVKAIQASIKWAGEEISKTNVGMEIERFEQFIAGCEREIKRRDAEAAPAPTIFDSEANTTA